MAEKNNSFLEEVLSRKEDEEASLSLFHEVAGIQDSFCFRNVYRARILAQKLVADDGSCHPFSGPLQNRFYPSGFSDQLIYERQKKFLQAWNDSIMRRMQRFGLPLAHRGAEKVVRETLALPPSVVLTTAHVRRAVLSSCLTVLRQNVGSCFATAPAILIHEEQIESYLDDLYDLLTMGRLKRTFGGIEYSVPMSMSWGIGDLRRTLLPQAWCSPGLLAAFEAVKILDPTLSLKHKLEQQQKRLSLFLEKKLTVLQVMEAIVPPSRIEEAKAVFKAQADNALLKMWEFTLASFSEVKMEFSRWNLYTSLGLNPEMKGGIGEAAYHVVEGFLQEANKKATEFHNEYLSAFDQLRLAERLLKNASSESEARRLRAEYQGRLHHAMSCKELMEHHHDAAKRYSQFFSFVIKQYDLKFPEFFQEIYDPEMIEASFEEYDDRPAGFRLVYKHGRSDVSLWTPIHKSEEYVKALVDFFNMSEPQIADACEQEDEKQKLSSLTSLIIQHVRSEGFIKTAIARMAKQGRTPWAYVSGGTMETLAKTYFCREGDISRESRWVESDLDLLVFIIDALKTISPSIQDLFFRDPDKGMLMQSPTHAFVLKPGWDLLREGWQEGGFTYTWIRDRFLHPMQQYYDDMPLSPEEQHFLMGKFSVLCETESRCPIPRFRDRLVQMGCQNVDAMLYQALPLIPGSKCQAALQKLVQATISIEFSSFLTAFELITLAKSFLAQKEDPSEDIHLLLVERARELGYAPRPFLFADSNWTGACFGFVVNPGTAELELWRLDRTGLTGMPMSIWKQWLSGADKASWVIYTNPFQYQR